MERSKAATPTPETADRYNHVIDAATDRSHAAAVLNESFKSGYDADREDTDESFIEAGAGQLNRVFNSLIVNL